MHVYESLPELIGNTPILHLNRYGEAAGTTAHIYAKLEYFNPLGSVKDRAALYMIQAGEKDGSIRADTVIIEPTSGNTGIGLAFICATRGYRLILTMPENMSKERIQLLSALGAEIVLTPAWEGMAGAVNKAQALHDANPNSVIPDQFSNPANVQAHVETTSREILRDMDGQVDFFVSSIGTGGTLTGNGKVLKEANPDCKVIGVEPAASPLLSKGKVGPHKIQGIGANFIPEILDRNLIDEIIPVTDEDAYKTCKALAKAEGLLVGISSGAAIWAATELAKRPENQGKRIVALLADTGERYLSVNLYG
ncbi:MAG: cysteine synthase A [Oscillospiraceae bacterium]|nr:cysteine synthase A [Oscillospiraceae bacterium]